MEPVYLELWQRNYTSRILVEAHQLTVYTKVITDK